MRQVRAGNERERKNSLTKELGEKIPEACDDVRIDANRRHGYASFAIVAGELNRAKCKPDENTR